MCTICPNGLVETKVPGVNSSTSISISSSSRTISVYVQVLGNLSPIVAKVTLVVSFISILFPNLFDMIGMAEYHPRVQLRWQLARILLFIPSEFIHPHLCTFCQGLQNDQRAANVGEEHHRNDRRRKLQPPPRARSLLSVMEDATDSTTTLFSPYNCTYIIIHNCTLAALSSGILTDLLTSTTTTTQPNVSMVDGDYFLDNSTSEEDLAYGSLIGNIANLTASGMASWNVSRTKAGRSAYRPAAGLLQRVLRHGPGGGQADIGTSRWTTSVSHRTTGPRGETSTSLSARLHRIFHCFLYNETTTSSHSTATTEEDLTSEPTNPLGPLTSTAPSPSPSAPRNPPPPSTPVPPPPMRTPRWTTWTSRENGTDLFENATSPPSCPRYVLDEDAPCPSRCTMGERKYRMPTTEDLLIIPDETKDLLRKMLGNRIWTGTGEADYHGPGDDSPLHHHNGLPEGRVRALTTAGAGTSRKDSYFSFVLCPVQGWACSSARSAGHQHREAVHPGVRAQLGRSPTSPRDGVPCLRSNNFYYALAHHALPLHPARRVRLRLAGALLALRTFQLSRENFQRADFLCAERFAPFMVDVVKYLTSPGVVIPLLLLLV
ncbi:transmembrane channel-like protein 3 [Caerostris extrusa]|uniref:Transmembrane channel-like protein 3 n=1 Tax=Caerostris extrusa TaxID=172846 RepID=A0AAV4NJ72_CAEEX|nr:transmembrane channel-like protein 3 [Caerostris extrusa]